MPIFPAQQPMAQSASCGPSIGAMPSSMVLPRFECPPPSLPPLSSEVARPLPTMVLQPTPIVSRPNLVVLTSTPHVEQSSTVSSSETPVVLRPITVQKGSGTKFTPAQMAKRDEDKLVKCNWEVQKALLFKLPLNRVLNLFFHMRGRVRGNPRLNNMFSLMPTRFHNSGIGKIPPGWTLKDELPMLPGHKPLSGIIPITMFEIDEVADDANFEQVAKTVETVIAKARPKVPSVSPENNSSANTSTSTTSCNAASMAGK
ncbi:hypothetical protein OSTOST_11761, partial [Ostertagia ostertagi]